MGKLSELFNETRKELINEIAKGNFRVIKTDESILSIYVDESMTMCFWVSSSLSIAVQFLNLGYTLNENDESFNSITFKMNDEEIGLTKGVLMKAYDEHYTGVHKAERIAELKKELAELENN